MTSQGIGASIPRKEDARFLRGKGQYVADFHMPGTMEIAFVRSPIAHGILRGVNIPEHRRGRRRAQCAQCAFEFRLAGGFFAFGDGVGHECRGLKEGVGWGRRG
jgi:hypothetical protein